MSESTTARRIGVAPLSAISAEPEEYLAAAAAAGFDFVALRVAPITVDDVAYTPTGPEFRRLLALAADSGLDVVDVEVFSVGPGTGRDDWLPVLQMAAELGASLLNVVGSEPDAAAFEDTMGRLAADARDFSVIPIIEPVAFRPMNSYARAIEVARSTGCGVEIDALHALRTGADLDLVAANNELFPLLQLCDAPAALRRWGGDRPVQAKPGDDDMLIEARLNRLLPGRGDAPLGRMLAALAPRTPVSVEIPNLELQSGRSVQEYFELLHREAVEFLAGLD